MNLNWLDIVLIIIVASSVVEGVKKGFARVGIGFAASIVGIVGGIWFYGYAGSFLVPYVSSSGIANFIGFWIVFIACVVAGGVIGNLLALAFKWAGISWLDRGFGAVFGFLRAMVFAIALVLGLVAFSSDPPPTSVVQSHFAPYVLGAANVCVEFAPRDLKDSFFESSAKVKEIWSEAVKKTRKLPTSTL